MKKQMFKKRFMLATLLALFACLQSFATSNVRYYTKAVAIASPNGAGTVYVSNKSADDATSETHAGRSEAENNATTNPQTYYLHATPAEGKGFAGWARTEDGNVEWTDNPLKLDVTGNQYQNAPVTSTRYAIFKDLLTYYSKVWVHPGEGGKVAINKTGNEPESYIGNQYQEEQNSKSAGAATHTYYIYAKAEDGHEFIGWSKTEGGEIVSTDARYKVEVSAESNEQDDPTEYHYYANFSTTQTYYSQVEIQATRGGMIYLNTTGEDPYLWWSGSITRDIHTASATPQEHSYHLFAKADDGYMFDGWATTEDGETVSTDNPYIAKILAESTNQEEPTAAQYYAKFRAVPGHYSKLTLKLNGNNDINNLGTTMLGGKVYVGKTAEEAESAQYEWTSESTQVTFSESSPTHEYYLYAKADEGFEFAGFGTNASATTSFNSSNNPYKVTVSATSTDEAAPTEKVYYASFKYAADNKPTVCYANFTVVTMLSEDDGTGTYVNRESDEPAQIGINYNDAADGKGENVTVPVWHAGSSYASEVYSKPYTSGTVYFPFTIFVKPNVGYEFVGWTSTSTTTNPSQKGTTEGDYNYYYSDSYTRTSVSNTNYPGSCGVEGGAKTKKYYAVFRKIENIEEPTGETSVAVTSVTGTTELVEGSISKDFTVDIVLSEDVPYDKPGSDKNAKPVEVLKQFVTVTGENGNNSSVTNYSLVYESKDLGEDGDGISLGTAYTSHTLRLSFPYNIKADTYTVHLPYGLYTTVNGNKTPTYEFTITVTEDFNPYFTLSTDAGSQFPADNMTIKYKAANQMSTPDPDKGEFEKSNITAYLKFNEVVESIDETKKDGIVLLNSTNGVNYKPTNVIRNAAQFGKVSGEVSIAFPELVNGSYTLTIPEGLFVGAGKVNESKIIAFTVSGFNSVQLKPYEMVTDIITPKANDMSQYVEKLQNVEISYKGEFGAPVTVVGNASDIKVQRYTEEIDDSKDGGASKRTYYAVNTTTSVEVIDGKMVVTFSPALYAGMYEVQIPSGMVGNMVPGDKTMTELVNAGYAVNPAYSNLSFKVESGDPTEIAVNVKAANKYGTLIVPFETALPDGLNAYTVTDVKGNSLVMEPASCISANTAYLIENTKSADLSATLVGYELGQSHDDQYTTGLLTGTYTQIVGVPEGNYLLQNQDGEVGFYKVTTSNLKLGANRCYLTKPAASADVKAFFFDEETAIKALEAMTSGKADIYDLNGRKLQKLQKGINIVNGVKVMVK